jgi:carbamate kinase
VHAHRPKASRLAHHHAVQRGGQTAVISSPEKLELALAAEAGTSIVAD